METLRYADEVKKCETAFDGVPDRSVDKDLIALAEELIEKKSGKFHPEKFKDSYTVALRELIDAKLQKRPPKAIEETPPVSNVINLMDALKRSVGKGSTRGAKGASASRKRRGGPAKARKKAASARRRRNGRQKAAA
jgi:DNA end-binding protein Ku